MRVRVCGFACGRGCGMLRQRSGNHLQGLCVRVEVDMMAENRVHTYRRGSTSGVPSSPSAPELVRRYRHPRSGCLVHPHMGRARVRGVVGSGVGVSEGLRVFGCVNRYAFGSVCVSVCEFVLVLVSMPISVPLSISADTSVDGGFVCVCSVG